ncbi:GNAT family N-acetyltransferase [Actinopolyspora saharensis]|uniref:Acetyltransferase (GNAT) domain-containing protein n=1 Tax=Actinopolyspora saharensis TaxID=995062 RepID=A0A1H1AF15_9ACTN|nr:GNAT family N-acetyltransferase [Actinopolyspora saharensis]SDQ38305.1 Acetyltransferase (GNAT) domain-containing protein [Actinopolyspora saharensis]
MNNAQELLEAQQRRFRRLDPALPAVYPLPRHGEPVLAHLDAGRTVAGVSAHAHQPPGTLPSLWSTADTYELFPLLGEHPRAGMDVLLRAFREQLATRAVPERDSACLVTWPSRDVSATRALLDHGFTPLTCLAVRTPTPEVDTKLSGTVKMRRAGPPDSDRVVELAMAELEYAALVGGSVLRPDAAGLKRSAVEVRLRTRSTPGSAKVPGGAPVWLAERNEIPVGLAECGWVDANNHHSGHRIGSGLWGYVNCLSVREEHRGTGIGRDLMTMAHNDFAAAGAVGSFLYYNPANPVSPVFWHRQGYRPLWTIWEIRPATALR